MQLIDQIMREQRVNEPAAAGGEDALARLRLKARTDSIGSSRMIVELRQVGSASVFDTMYFLGAFIASPKGLPGGIGSNAAACVT